MLKRENAYNVLLTMVILRVVLIWFIIMGLFLFLIALAIVTCLRGCKPIEHEKLEQIPVLNQFLASKARRYDPKTH